jgi:hypothetical protein
MKKRYYIIFCWILFSACATHKGSGNLIRRDIQVTPFDAIEANGPFEVILTQGTPSGVVLEIDDNLTEYAEIEVDDETLYARVDDGSFRDATFRLLVTVPELRSIKAAASADIRIKGAFKYNRQLFLSSSSGSEISGQVDAPEIEATSSSGSEINLSGRTKKLNASASSGASVKAEQLLSEDTDAEASSGAGVYVHASVKLHAKASSGGKVGYRGGAQVNESESSGGEVKKEQ